MAQIENVRGVSRRDFGEVYPVEDKPARGKTLLEDPAGIARHGKLWGWYQEERDRQAINRYQMALDEDFYDGLQWGDEDAQALIERGQAPLVFNLIHPTIEWLVGTEKRTRMDWHVYPRGSADVEDAQTKKTVLKYINDNNKVGFAQSQAFKDSVTVGVGWLEDGVRNDPTKDPIYSGWESWRYVWYDSFGKQLDGSDWRYVFRKRNVDLDIAHEMFPQYRAHLTACALKADGLAEDEEENWYLGTRMTSQLDDPMVFQRRIYSSSWGWVNSDRERVPLVEAWYRMPSKVQVMLGEKYHRETFDARSAEHRSAVDGGYVTLVDAVRMQVWCAIMTEGGLLQNMRSPYRHDRFPLTPLWCYRRGRDGAPYGIVRNIRDPQEDLNKRRSKSLHILATKQLIADNDAFDDADLEDVREELAAPDGILRFKRGAKYEVIQDKDVAETHMKMEVGDREYIRESAGITGESLGLQSNVISGKAVLAKQQQGSLQTATPFDNKRLAVQISGEIQVSLMEQYYSEPKVVRITETKTNVEFLEINQPEVQPDGSIRYLNDITRSKSDFVVDEVDYKESVRAAMFETMMGLLSRFQPEVALQLMDHVLELADIPNKEEFIADIRRLAGKPNPEGPKNAQEAQQAAQVQAEADRMKALKQRNDELVVAELEAKVNKLNAEAEKISAEARVAGVGDAQPDDSAVRSLEEKVRDIQAKAGEQLSGMRNELQLAAVEMKNRQDEIAMKERMERDKLALERDRIEAEKDLATIEANGKAEVARIQGDAQRAVDELMKQLETVANELAQVKQATNDAAQIAQEESAKLAQDLQEELEKRDAKASALEQSRKEVDLARKEEQSKAEKDRKEDKQDKGEAPAQPVIGELHIHAGGGKRTGTIARNADGSLSMKSADADETAPDKAMDQARKRRRIRAQKQADGSTIFEEVEDKKEKEGSAKRKKEDGPVGPSGGVKQRRKK